VPNFTLSCYKDGNVIYQDEFRDWDMKRVEVYENWVRYNRSLNLPVNSDRLTFSVEGDYVSLDKLLFRPANSNVHQLINDSLMYMDGYMVLPPNFEHSN